MIARYYSSVLCLFEATREQLHTWSDQCAEIGDDLGEPNLFDISFSADFGKFEIGIEAAHRAIGVEKRWVRSDPLAVWGAASEAIGHAATMFKHIGAIKHLRLTQAVITRGVGDNEQLLMNIMTVWHNGAPGATTTPAIEDTLPHGSLQT